MNLTAQGVGKEYPRKTRASNCFTALQPLDLTLESGTLTVLNGRSGSGKSTLLHILGGLLNPTSGKVLADGKDLYTMPDKELSLFRNRHIGMIPQGQTVIYSLTVLENVLLPVALYGSAGKEDISRANALLEELGIRALADCRPSELSGGELRRMAIARALFLQPEIILADEPTADLDEENTQVVFQCFRHYAQQGKTLLVVTHETCMERYTDVLYTMKNGSLQRERQGDDDK